MHTETSSASSVGILEDIFRLIPSSERAAFGEMLAHELRGRELPDGDAPRRRTHMASLPRLRLANLKDGKSPSVHQKNHS
jgi:hypothetical protein